MRAMILFVLLLGAIGCNVWLYWPHESIVVVKPESGRMCEVPVNVVTFERFNV